MTPNRKTGKGGTWLAALALAALAATAAPQEENPRTAITVRVDPRVELMSVIFRLAGNPEYGKARIESYVDDVEEHFGPHRNHAVVRRARNLRGKYGVSFDAVMSMAVHITDAEKIEEAVPFKPHPAELDTRWSTRDARAFLKDARAFAKKTKFAKFIADHRELYDTAAARMQKLLDERAKLGWFDEFFGARQGAKFELVLGMLNGPGNYAARLVHPDGKEDLYCVLGVWLTDDEGLPYFDDSVLSTVVHEFSHSYCNPLVYANEDALRPSGERLWPHVESSMVAQAYGNWRTMMCESLVRACVVRYQAADGGEDARRKEVADQHRRQFLWVGEYSDLLAEYEKDRKKYPTLGDFFPRIVEFFDTYAERFEKTEGNRPKVVSLSPENGARDVDPKTKTIKITFDRKMRDGCWAVVGGGPNYPKTKGRPSYDRAQKVLTLQVELQPNWRYEFWLNRGRFDSFMSHEGVKLRPVRVEFWTGP